MIAKIYYVIIVKRPLLAKLPRTIARLIIVVSAKIRGKVKEFTKCVIDLKSLAFHFRFWHTQENGKEAKNKKYNDKP